MIVDLPTFTWIHTATSLVALAAGIVVVFGLVTGRALPRWTVLFLATAVLTSVTGFGFPFDRFLPSHWVGVISLVLLALAIVGRYSFHLAGTWGRIYAISTVTATYLLVFVGIAQAFLKVPALKAAAPTSSELPFAASQVATLAVFIVLAFAAAKTFRGGVAAHMHA